MKILMVTEYFPPHTKGGGELSCFSLAKELSKHVDIHVLTSFFEGEREETVDGIKVHKLLKSGKDPSKIIDNVIRLGFKDSLLRELIRLDKIEDFDIIHCMNTTSIYAVMLKDQLKKKFILHINSPVLFCPKGTLMYKDIEQCERVCSFKEFTDCYLGSKMIGKLSLNPALKYNPYIMLKLTKRVDEYQRLMLEFDSYMAISTYMEKRLMMSGIERSKIKKIYNILDLKGFENLKRPKNKVKKILYLGEYSPAKGPQVLLQALKALKLPFEANFYGSGSLEGQLKSDAEGMAANINPALPYAKIPETLQKHDIVVIPSLVAEGFGRVALEARAAGKTVLASRIGGLPDALDDEDSLFSPGNDAELANRLVIALTKKSSSRKRKLPERFRKENIIDEVLSVYRRLSR